MSSQLFIYLQSVQAYISPPIAVCFIFGILWPRVNGTGALSSLLTGFVLGSARFILEILVKTGRVADAGLAGWLVGINFLHYAVLMFAVCALVLVAVSLLGEAPDRRRLAGLTFATVDDKLEGVTLVAAPKPAAETARELRINVAFSFLLVATVVGLWIHFR
jgi:SSS family solute:Na+ symporter